MTTEMNKVPWWRTQLDENEANAAGAAILDGRLSQGPVVAELEAKFAKALDVPFAMMTTSGSTALTTALIAAGIKAGDEVIVPNRTFIATAHAAQLIGATVRLADVMIDSPVIDPADVARKITDKTRAIMPMHVNGCACDMSALQKLANEHDLIIVEDAAQALFSKHQGRFLGTFGNMGCYSLGVTKIMTSGQGGLVVTQDEEMYTRAQYMRFHGVPAPKEGEFNHFGFNFRYTDILASVALKQFERIPQKIERHLALHNRYKEAFHGLNRITLEMANLADGQLPLWIQVLCDDRDELVRFLDSRGIGTVVPSPSVSLSPHMNDDEPFPNSAYFNERELILPSGPDQAPEDIERTIEALLAFERL